jgi:hypothetical protein
MQRFRKLALMLGSLALMIGLLGSGGMTTAQDADFPVNIRFFNAMTALETVDVYINGEGDEQRVVEGLAYGTVSDAFTGTAPATNVLIKQNVNLSFDRYLYNTIIPTEAGKEYLVVITDLILIPTEFDQSPTGADMARVRAINAAAQAPALDLYATASGDMASPVSAESPVASPVSAEPIVADLGFGRVTDGGEIPVGSYDVTATATGTETVAVEASGIAIDAGQVYAVVIYGQPGDTDTPLSILPVSVPASS